MTEWRRFVDLQSGALLSPAPSFAWVQIACPRFDPIQSCDAVNGFVRDLTAAGFMQIDELAPRMHPAAQFGDAVGEQHLVAGKSSTLSAPQRLPAYANTTLGLASAAARYANR